MGKGKSTGFAQVVHAQRRVFLLGLATGGILIAVGFLLALLALARVEATHTASGNIHACVNIYSSQTWVMLPGRAPSCNAGEVLVEWAGPGVSGDIGALEARMDALEAQAPECPADEAGDAAKGRDTSAASTAAHRDAKLFSY